MWSHSLGIVTNQFILFYYFATVPTGPGSSVLLRMSLPEFDRIPFDRSIIAHREELLIQIEEAVSHKFHNPHILF